MTRGVLAGLRHTVTDAGVVLGYRAGFSAIRALPAAAAYRLFDTIADAATRKGGKGGKGVQRLRANYARVRPELDDGALDRLVRDGMRSYMRYYCDAFRLPDRTPDELLAATRATGDGPIREALAARRGAVVFVCHMGNWDTAAAWSTTHLAPVTTVAERLEPEEVFREFFEFRESLGMTILPLTGGDDPFTGLKKAVERGDFVALVADRDLTHNGLEVDLCGHRARMAKGPAVLALMTRAPLFAAAIHYEDAPQVAGSGKGIVIEFSPQIPVPDGGSTRDKVATMIQGCADFIGQAITAHTVDWHMLQRVFVDDLDPVAAARMSSGSTGRAT